MEVFEPHISGDKIFPWKPLKIVPIGDIQYSGQKGPADLKRLERYLKFGLENDAYFIGMGDYLDFASPSNRQRLQEASLYDTASAVIDQAATELESELFEVLAPTRGRWLTLVEGHHYFMHLDGTTTGQRLANFLGCRYGGDSVLMRLVFRQYKKESYMRGIICKIFVHHGHGGAITLGGPLARLERQLGRIMAQALFIGHHHQQQVTLVDALDVTDSGIPHLFHVPRAIILTGSFMRGWLQDYALGNRPQGTYVEQKMLPPVTLGSPIVEFTPRRVRPMHGIEYKVVEISGTVKGIV